MELNKRITSKHLRYLLIVVLSILFGNDAGAQQSFTFTQYMNNLTPYNSAYSVVKQSSSINFLGRKQWVGIDGAPSSLVFNGDAKMENINSSLGFIVMNDKVAIESLSDINVFFAKSVQLSEDNFLAASLNGGIKYYVANYSQLDAADPKFATDIRQFSPTVGLGVLFYNPDRYYIGLSLPRLSFRSLGTASVNNNRYRNTWYFSGAYLFDIAEDIKLKPAFLYSYTRGVPSLTDVSATIYFKSQFGIGANYRSTKEVAGILSYLFGNNVNLAYSYQTGTGSVNDGSFRNATHEVSIGYRFGSGDGKVL